MADVGSLALAIFTWFFHGLKQYLVINLVSLVQTFKNTCLAGTQHDPHCHYLFV